MTMSKKSQEQLVRWQRAYASIDRTRYMLWDEVAKVIGVNSLSGVTWREKQGNLPKHLRINSVAVWSRIEIQRWLDDHAAYVDRNGFAEILGFESPHSITNMMMHRNLPAADKQLGGRNYWLREKAERFAKLYRSRNGRMQRGNKGRLRSTYTHLSPELRSQLEEVCKREGLRLAHGVALAVEFWLREGRRYQLR